MSRLKMWQYTCDYYGQTVPYEYQSLAKLDGWKTRGKADFCSKACWRQSKEHSL